MGKRSSGVPLKFVGVRMPVPLYEKLINYAYENGKTVSSVVRAALELFFMEEERDE